jgi:hypothetical protein
MNQIGVTAFRLPPLILHPFSKSEDSSMLEEGSRASLTLQGFLPRESVSLEELWQRLSLGRYAELRMLYYIGKDLMRWLGQCVETVEASGFFSGRLIRPETFAVFLIEGMPTHVQAKLEGWGVVDFCSLFRRAIGLHSVLNELPPPEAFVGEFLRVYHRFVDAWYEQRLRETAFDRPRPDEFTFDLYASGEYTLILEQSWSEGWREPEV